MRGISKIRIYIRSISTITSLFRKPSIRSNVLKNPKFGINTMYNTPKAFSGHFGFDIYSCNTPNVDQSVFSTLRRLKPTS